MTEMPPPTQMEIRQGKKSLLKRLSLVWLVPLIALVISLGVAWQSYQSRGALIEISFENASGISADETAIKYRDVTVGRVEKVSFGEGLTDVLIHARIDKDIMPYLDDDAQFWVVRPDVSVRGISGLDTVLGGVYIEGNWDTEADEAQYAFVGLETPPLTRAGQRGTQIVLRANDGSALQKGAPVLHKGIQVGYLETPELARNGSEVRVTAFIEEPYDRTITSATRFWDTSGFSLSFGASGVSLDVSSLASLIEGGVAFDTVVSGGQAIRDGQLFELFGNEEVARDSLFNDPDRPVLNVSVLFDQTVSGLTKGSEVRFQGIRVGVVAELAAIVVEDSANQQQVQLRTVLAIEPARLGLPDDATPEDALDFLTDFVDRGLRARMITGNILSGSLVVQLLEVPDAPPEALDRTAQPYPTIPITESEISDVAASAEGVLARINDLPVEELMDGAIDLMDSIERLVSDDNVRAVPESTVALLEDIRTIVASEDVQTIPAEVRDVIAQIDTIVADIASVELATKLAETLNTANTAVANVDSATSNLPEISAQLEALVTKANGLDIETLLAQTTATLDTINNLVGSEAAAALPANVSSALAEVEQLVADTRALVTSDDLQAVPADLRKVIADLDSIITGAIQADLVAQLNATISNANTAVTSINDATQNLPQIMTEIEQLATKANSLEVEELVTQTTQTLATIDTLIGSDATADLPASVSAALDEMRLFLAEVREGGAIENVNAALASANEAAQAIEQAAASLPALSARASALVNQTGAVLDNYSERSRFNAETLATLRDIQAAADAVSSLARAIQRNPNSLLVGR